MLSAGCVFVFVCVRRVFPVPAPMCLLYCEKLVVVLLVGCLLVVVFVVLMACCSGWCLLCFCCSEAWSFE